MDAERFRQGTEVVLLLPELDRERPLAALSGFRLNDAAREVGLVDAAEGALILGRD